MDRSKAPPLQSLSLPSRPLTSHAIAWSSDAELAVATSDGIHVFLPEYPRSSGGDGEKPPSERYATSPQFPVFLQTSGSLRPDPAINTPLCLFAGAQPPPPPANGPGDFPGVGGGKITGAGASLGQVVRVEWSPGGLGANLRPVLTALTGHGAVTCFGEHFDLGKSGGGASGESKKTQVRSFKNWRILWGLGARLPLPRAGGADVQIMDERITSFSWAKDLQPGRALLAYETDDKHVVVMAVQFYSRDSAPDEKGWDIREVARFDASGPHVAVDPLDPDFVSSGSAFSLKWSPWVTYQGKQTAVLSYIANNHVGFRRVVIEELWKHGDTPAVKVDEHDMKGLCLSLSTDAFLEWENTSWSDGDGPLTVRGIVASPFVLYPFQIPFTDPMSAAIPRHKTSLCSTTYPNQDTPTNPITGQSPNAPLPPPHDYPRSQLTEQPTQGLVIHHADPSLPRPPVPHYSLVRQSCTATNQNWFQTTLPEDDTPLPQWAEDLGQRTVRRIPLARALRGKYIDSSSDSSDPEPDDDDEMPDSTTAAERRQTVHPRRFRLWGLAASPGDGCTAAVVSRHSTQHPSRRDRAEVMFGWHVPPDGDVAGIKTVASLPRKASTEARVWEWLYGRGPEVPGTTHATSIPLDSNMVGGGALRRQFREVLARVRCVFCDGALRETDGGADAVCSNGHSFGKSSSLDGCLFETSG
ncbi:hypothetical protein ISF_05414 [Cordyceps fumosorosea ARSEF 2679]|uniref:Transcription factor IIIC 90kDa subunit N-terminal domain-containing protein n=1 Tax=Cordyceps fumosorosea (strain ARSEF 2679) TaxID=1081104 RepID=A0A167U8H6_CORFA|nr:hypothetical protein ISF_05414 [Cordyceps fumosorosea ARSEF 2679]OAA61335.1 hypothetical protein ISF_05414 [Cordyceps fumosorosea ARSEF 2679]